MKKRDIVVIIVIILAALALIIFLRPGAFKPSTPPAATPTAAPFVIDDTSANNQNNPAEASISPSSPEGSLSPVMQTSQEGVQAFLQIIIGQTKHLPYPLIGEGELVLTQEGGQTNVIHYTPTSFVMHSSTCDGQDCIAQGEVTLENMDKRVFFNSVICLPNQVSVSLLTPQEAQNDWKQYYGIQ